jgi:hypothetical protein
MLDVVEEWGHPNARAESWQWTKMLGHVWANLGKLGLLQCG